MVSPFDGAGDRAVGAARRLGRGGQCLPVELQIQVNAGFKAQNEGELDIGFDRLALLVFLRGFGLHDEDVVLVFRAVRAGTWGQRRGCRSGLGRRCRKQRTRR